jgi:hypothetical protein
VTPPIPHGLPVLGRGRHHDPTHGACLMEATALLAGQPPTDHPDCVHPLIAAVARITNDAVSDSTRQGLLRLAPAAAATATDNPRVVDDLVLLVCGQALPLALPIWAPALRHALRQARRRQRGQSVLTRWARRRAEAAVRYATISLALANTADRDDRLTRLLIDCLSTVQRSRRSAASAGDQRPARLPGASPPLEAAATWREVGREKVW